MKPEIVRVPARQGAQWLLLSWRTFWRRPWIFVLLTLLQLGCTTLASCFAPVMSNLDVVLVPFFALAMMLAASEVAAGQRAGLATQLMTTGRRRLLTLLALGVLLYALCVFGINLLMAWLLDPANIGQPPNLKMLFLVGLGGVALLAFLSLFMMLAPGLIHWYDVSLPQALLLSAGVGLRNWLAFMLFGLLSVGVCGAALVVATGLLTRAGVTGNALTATLIGPLLIWSITLMISNFFILRDCFVAESARFPAPSDAGMSTT